MSIFINEITVSDAGPDIIRSHLFHFSIIIMLIFRKVVTIISELDPGRILALQKEYLLVILLLVTTVFLERVSLGFN